MHNAVIILINLINPGHTQGYHPEGKFRIMSLPLVTYIHAMKHQKDQLPTRPRQFGDTCSGTSTATAD